MIDDKLTDGEVLDLIYSWVEEKTEYDFHHKGRKVEKEVYWYIGETGIMDVQISHEHRDYLWLDWEQAVEMLTHIESKAVLNAAHKHMKKIGRE